MAVGTIATSVLTDIANAIRYQSGTSTLYKPREMAGAVLALDGGNAGGYAEQPYMELRSGVVSDSVFAGLGAAIRAQNGLGATYTPGEMAAAILALEFDIGLKIRALLLADGTMEFSYRDGGASPLGAVARRFEVAAEGYASQAARPWDSVKLDVSRVVFDATFADAGMTNLTYLCASFENMTEVAGFEHCQGATSVAQMFTSCVRLETIWATAFDNSSIAAYSGVLYGCSRLVGGADGFVPSTTTGKAAVKLGAGGVLTDPAADGRVWCWGTVYADGACEISASGAVDAGRQAVAHGRFCANARYALATGLPWSGAKGAFTRVRVLADMAAVESVNMNYWFYAYPEIAAFEGLGNLKGVSGMRYAFASCTGVASLDLRGFEPGGLTDLFYAFSGCTALATILVDADWALPASGVSGMQCFYNCKALVGGNGTAWSSGNTGYTYMRVDAPGAPGYLTAG